MAEDAFNELDRLVAGTSWGVAIAHDVKGKNAAKWQRLRKRHTGQSAALSTADMERAVFALAAADPSLVKVVPSAP